MNTRKFHPGTDVVRFWSHVDRRGPDECWPWKAWRHRTGHGTYRTWRNGKRETRGAHVISWELHNGHVPSGYFVLHRCNNALCVNPKHLKLGDHAENMADRRAAGNYFTGERHHLTKYSDAIVAEIRASAEPTRVFIERYGISRTQVKNIRRGRQRPL